MKLYLVGGFVRDQLLGIPNKDVDICVVTEETNTAEDAFSLVRTHLLNQGFSIHVEEPEYLTLRCGAPKGHPLRIYAKDCDFVIARKDGPSSDGRRPDWVSPGSLFDDLSRREYTANAVAKDPLTGEFIDPHGGIRDIENRVLRFVGDPKQRIREDGLRVLRGFRFIITKGFTPTPTTSFALTSQLAVEMLGAVSVERIREELERMLHHDTIGTLRLLGALPDAMQEVVFRDGLRMSATLKD